MKRARAAAVCVTCAIALGGCATLRSPSARAFAEATPLCAILENPKPYLSRRLLVRGYLSESPHGREFWDKGCERGFIPLRLSPETARARRLRSVFVAYAGRSPGRTPGAPAVNSGAFESAYAGYLGNRPPRVPVVYSGIFTDHGATLVCDQICSSFSLETAELVAVRAY